jgi:RimJ/RimL family protein N-acetyltransferase
MQSKYLFTSERLGFRGWTDTDLAPMTAINADPEVMEFFPGTKTLVETEAFVARMQQQLIDRGYCYFAVDLLSDGAFIGFTGLSEQTFEASFTPCIDIGWRLGRQYWGHGYATEAAQRCLAYAMKDLNINKISSIAPRINIRSVRVMEQAGMAKVDEFVHPLLAGDERLRDCVLYEIAR